MINPMHIGFFSGWRCFVKVPISIISTSVSTSILCTSGVTASDIGGASATSKSGSIACSGSEMTGLEVDGDDVESLILLKAVVSNYCSVD